MVSRALCKVSNRVPQPQVFLVKEWRDTVTEVGDQQSLVASLRQSPYFSMFQDQIEGWEKRLNVLLEALGSMSAVQRKWLYLEPIFARGALPEQSQRFRQVQPLPQTREPRSTCSAEHWRRKRPGTQRPASELVLHRATLHFDLHASASPLLAHGITLVACTLHHHLSTAGLVACTLHQFLCLHASSSREHCIHLVHKAVQVDTSFKSIMARIAADPLVRTFSDVPGIEKTLEGLLASLDACQNALFEFLELKRSVFPRYAVCRCGSSTHLGLFAAPEMLRQGCERVCCVPENVLVS